MPRIGWQSVLVGDHGARRWLLTIACVMTTWGCAGRAPQPQPVPAPTEAVSERADCEPGVATFYADEFAGRQTANGEHYHPAELTAAHRRLPFGSQVVVSYHGRSVTVRINDRGPYAGKATIDLSHRAAELLGIIEVGHAAVSICRR